MMDVEGLLRETLNDPRRRLEPVPGMFETVRERARQRRQRVVRLVSALSVIVVIAGVATAIGIRTQSHTKVAAPPSITPSPPTGQATSVNLGQGSTSSFDVTLSGVFVARTQPDQLLALSSADLSVSKRIATADAAEGTAADVAAGRVWTWSSTEPTDSAAAASGNSAGTGSTSIHAYDTSTLAMNTALTVSAYAFSAVALNGDLWLATSDGLYVVGANTFGPTVTKVASGLVFSVAADAVRHRILYGSPVSTPAAANTLGDVVVHEIDANTHTVIGIGTPLPIGKESIAIVSDQIWVAGYGSGSTPRLFHLDGSSLQTLQTTGFGAGDPGELGPGAIVWPGASVLWVRSGGSEALACVDPQTGALLEQWDVVQGPVASVRGHAYAASDGSLDQLSLAGDCTG